MSRWIISVFFLILVSRLGAVTSVVIEVSQNGQPVAEAATVSGAIDVRVTVTDGIGQHVQLYGNMLTIPFNESGHAPDAAVWSHTASFDTRRCFDGENLLSVHVHPHNIVGQPYTTDFTVGTFKIVSANSNPASNGDRLLPTVTFPTTDPWAVSSISSYYVLNGDAAISDDSGTFSADKQQATASPVQMIPHLGESVLGRFRWTTRTPPFGDQILVKNVRLLPFQRDMDVAARVVIFVCDGSGRANYAFRNITIPALRPDDGMLLSIQPPDAKILGLSQGDTVLVPDTGSYRLQVQLSNLNHPWIELFDNATVWAGNRVLSILDLKPLLGGAASAMVEIPIPGAEITKLQNAKTIGAGNTAFPIWIDFTNGNQTSMPTSSHVHLNSLRTRFSPWPYDPPTVKIIAPGGTTGSISPGGWVGDITARYEGWGAMPMGTVPRIELDGQAPVVDSDFDGNYLLSGLQRGSHTIRITLIDANAQPLPYPSAVATATFAVVNRPPIAQLDSYEAVNAAALTVGAAAGLLANDSDPDGDPLTAEIESAPKHGTVVLSPDGSFVYTPMPAYRGWDMFRYHAKDSAPSSTSHVMIWVSGANGVASSSDWTMYGGDPAHSGNRNVHVGPVKPQLKWMQASGLKLSNSLRELAVADGLIFATGMDLVSGTLSYQVICLDADSGQIVWRRTLSSSTSGSISSPAYADGNLVIRVHDYNTWRLYSVRAATGEINWTTTFAATPDILSAPTIGGGKIFISAGGLRAYNQSDGSQAWLNTDFAADDVPAWWNGRVYSWNGGMLRELDSDSGSLLRTLKVVDAGGTGFPLSINDGIAYMCAGSSNSLTGGIFAVDLASFTKIWGISGDGYTGTPAKLSDELYVHYKSGVQILRASDGQKLKPYAIDLSSVYMTTTQPILCEDIAFGMGGQKTVLIDRVARKEISTLPGEVSGAGFGAFSDGALYVARYDSSTSLSSIGKFQIASTAPEFAPVARVSVSASAGTAPASIAFDGAGSTDQDGSIISYAWDFGDGQTGNGASLSHTYANAGTFLATLTVTDDDGAQNTACRKITVSGVQVDTAIQIEVSQNGQPIAEGVTVSGDVQVKVTVANGIGEHVQLYANFLTLPFAEPGHAPDTPIWTHTASFDTRRCFDGENLISVHVHPHNLPGATYSTDFAVGTFKVVTENANPAPNGDRLLPTLAFTGSWLPDLQSNGWMMNGDADVVDDSGTFSPESFSGSAKPVQIISHLGESVLGRFRWVNQSVPFSEGDLVHAALRPFQRNDAYPARIVFFFTDGAGRANYAYRSFTMPNLSIADAATAPMPVMDAKILGLAQGDTLVVPSGGSTNIQVQLTNVGAWYQKYDRLSLWVGNRSVSKLDIKSIITANPGAGSYTVSMPLPAGELVKLQLARMGGEITTASGLWVDLADSVTGNNPMPTSSHLHLNSIRTSQPSITIASPLNNTPFAAPGSIPINAAVTGTGTVTAVNFYQGTTLIGTDTTSPYSFTWTGVPVGTYSLTAKVTDNAGVVSTSAAVSVKVSSAPTLTFTTNGTGFVGPADIVLNATASDSDGTIKSVDFYQGSTRLISDTAAPYTYTWKRIGLGTYTLTAKATDNVGVVTTSAPIVVTVGQQAPTVELFFMTGTSYVAPSWVEMDATAADVDGTISKVDFYQGSTLLATDTTSPYAFTRMYTNSGVYPISAVATDNDGNTTTDTRSIIVASQNIDESGFETPAIGSSPGYQAGPTGSAWVFAPGGTDSSGNPVGSAGISANGSALTANNPNAPEGSQIAYIQGLGKISQYTAAGYGTYRLSFRAAQRSVVPASDSTIVVTLDGCGMTAFRPTSTSYELFSAGVTIGGGIKKLMFQGHFGDDNDMVFIDDVKLEGPFPRVEITPGTVLLGQTVTFAYNGGNPGRMPIDWDFGDGTTGTATSLTHVYGAAGTYNGNVVIPPMETCTCGCQEPEVYQFTVTVVANNEPPQIALTSDKAAYVAPASIGLNAIATDGDGTISKVEFYQGATLLGSDVTSPYSFVWNDVPTGTYALTAKATDNAGAVATSSVLIVTVNPAGSQVPYAGSPMAIPGTILTARYDVGGESIAYHDVEAYNFASSSYRPGEGVDSSGGGVGWIVAGEWLEYTVNVAQSGAYTFSIPISHPGTGGTMHVGFDGVNVTGTLPLLNTGGWDIYQNIVTTATLAAGVHVMQVAFDTNGSTGYGPGLKDIVIMNGASNNAPTVNLTAPANGASYSAPAAISLAATASDSDGTISKVEFYQGATLLGTDTTSPYSLAWSNVPTGTYALTAKATDNAGGVATSNAVTVTVNLVGSQTPYGGSPMAIPGTISTAQYDNGGEGTAYHDVDAINRMAGSFRVDQGVDTSGVGVGWIVAGEWLEYTVNVASAGSYQFAIPISHPGTGGTMHVSFDGLNVTGALALLNTGGWDIYQNVFTTATLAAGVHIMQVSFDTNGSTGYGPGLRDIVITANGASNNAPTVSLTAPANGASFSAPASISLTAAASDGDGTISKVEFYQSSTLLGADTSSPYSFNWTSVAAGAYALTAKATDNAGAVATSSVLNVTVNPAGSQVPYAGSPMAIPGAILTAQYDNGGEGIAYHDVEAYNFASSSYRPGDGVDSSGTGVGWIVAGEWLEYTVNVASSGQYQLSIPISHPGTGGTMHVSFDGVNVTGSLSLLNTGGWDIYQNIVTTINLAAGVHVMQVAFDTNGSTGYGPGLKDIVISTNGAPNNAPAVSLTAPVNGASYSAPAAISLAATASDNDGMIGKVEFYQGSSLLGTDTSSPYTFEWSNVPAGSYTFMAKATDNAGATTTSATVTITVTGSSAIPAPWQHQDIGFVGSAGSADAAGGTFTVRGSGSDIWNDLDAFHFVYQQLNGDGAIIARVASQQNTDPWAKAGVMIRESLGAGSRHALMVVTPSNGTSFQRRASTGGFSSHSTPGDGMKAPRWVKLVRSGNTLSGYQSADGVTWVLVGTDSIPMVNTVSIGLAVTAHNNAAISAASFDQVTPSGEVGPILPTSNG